MSDEGPRPDSEVVALSGDDSVSAAEMLQLITDTWVGPELESRGLSRSTPVSKALVVFPSKGSNSIYLDDEAVLHASIRATRELGKGNPVTAADFSEISDLRPAQIDADAGWIAYAQIGQGAIIAFDFRRNKGRASSLLDLSGEFLATAEECLEAERLRPAVENCYAAAELVAMAHMLVFAQSSGSHGRRVRWLQDWAELGNVPTIHSVCLTELAQRRGSARYGASPLIDDHEAVRGWIETTKDMLATARNDVDVIRAYVAPPPGG